jgi:hypothetical protein
MHCPRSLTSPLLLKWSPRHQCLCNFVFKVGSPRGSYQNIPLQTHLLGCCWSHDPSKGHKTFPVTSLSSLLVLRKPRAFPPWAHIFGSQFIRLFKRGLGGIALSEEVCRWGWVLRFQKCTTPVPARLQFLPACDQDVSSHYSSICLPACLPPCSSSL